MDKMPIYMDCNATTPVEPRVLEAMLPFYTEHFGNAASKSHCYGWRAENAVEKSREKIADLIGALPKEIVFTSGATESDNLAIKGVAETYIIKGNHIITVSTEHKAVIDTCRYLEKKGFEVTYLVVDEYGLIKIDELISSFTDKTILVSVMYGNNEIGTIQPVKEIGLICKERGIIFHCDATQGVGKVPFKVNDLNVDLVSFSSHKIYGPKGIGALYVRSKNPRVKLAEQMHGGGHERGMRSGTLNVPCIVGFGEACGICAETLENDYNRMKQFRDKMIAEFSGIENSYLNGHPVKRLPNNINFSFENVDSEGLMIELRDVAVSSSSACSSSSMQSSSVLKAIGRNNKVATLRFGLGRHTTTEEVDYAIKRTIETIVKLRERSTLKEYCQNGKDLKTV